MSVKHGSPVKFVRLGIAAALLVMAGALAFHLAVRRPGSVRPVSSTAAPDSQKIDRKEAIEHREYKDGKLWADVRARSFYLGEDGLNHLEGAVEIVDYGREDGRETRISAEKVDYDRDMIHFLISGGVKVRSRDFLFESGSLEYDKNLGRYSTRQGGAFSSDTLAGSAPALEHDEKKNEIRMSGGFRLDIKARPGSPGDSTLTGDSLIYERETRSGLVEGHVRLAAGDREANSGLLRFELDKNEGSFKSAVLENAARLLLAGAADQSGKRVVEAGTIRILSRPGSSRVSVVEAAGGGRLTLEPPPEPDGQVQAREVRLAFDPDGKLESWEASGEARMGLADGTGAHQDFAGEKISYSGQSGVLTVTAKEGEAARLESPELKIEASTVSLSPETKTAGASGAVRFFLKPRADGSPGGFFSRSEPIFFSCRAMSSSDGDRRFHLEGEVKAWQDDGSIQAGKLDYLAATGEVRAGGGVEAGFGRPPKGASGEARVVAGGDEMTFSPPDRTALFAGRAFVRMPDVRISAGTAALSLAQAKKELEGFLATRGVVVVCGDCEGRGEEARYDPAADHLVLTGRPVLVEKDKGASRGDKLTFRLADGKILIENKGQGRSITVVQREK
jgi:lipopolysaccharide export system protein LptA